MTASLTLDTPITSRVEDDRFELALDTVADAIELAKQITFTNWMDATNASGEWRERQADHSAELDFLKLNRPDVNLSTKFRIAIQVLHAKHILMTLKGENHHEN